MPNSKARRVYGISSVLLMARDRSSVFGNANNNAKTVRYIVSLVGHVEN